MVQQAELNIDLDWGDDDVVPEKVTRDLIFLFDRMIEATVDQIDTSKGNLVLDIGCGRAVDAIKVADRGCRPVGLEPSSKMLRHCVECVSESKADVGLVQGIGERLPFRDNAFDWVMCKGALDHFPDPYKTMEEISRVLKPDGRAVISIANFGSLGHMLGKNTHRITRFLPWRDRTKRQAWETPPDHTYRFDYALVRDVARAHLDIEESFGISFLWGAPLWDRFLAVLPNRVAFAIMGALDTVARGVPSLSDVVLVRCRQKTS